MDTEELRERFGRLRVKARTMEDAFFLQQDRVLIENLRVIKRMKETVANLRAVSGIDNDDVLEQFVELDIEPETVASLSVIPLIEVAWSDGAVDVKEIKAILDAVSYSSLGRGVCAKLMGAWLSHKPGPQLMQAWKQYVRGLRTVMPDEEFRALRQEIMAHARGVAKAAGGFLGVVGSKVTKEEKKMLEELEAAFTA